MVNTIEYRVECQILGTLHFENRLAKRFPIGKEVLINRWRRDDVIAWHRTHYRPDNVLLYIVGDIDPISARNFVEDKFGHISSEKQGSCIKDSKLKTEASKFACAVVKYDNVVKSRQSWHYPPVRHDFCFERSSDISIMNKKSKNKKQKEKKQKIDDYDLHLQNNYDLDEKVVISTKELAPEKKIRLNIFRHELLETFSFHLFAKRPIESITNILTLRRSLARRVAIAALQIRLNVGG